MHIVLHFLTIMSWANKNKLAVYLVHYQNIYFFCVASVLECKYKLYYIETKALHPENNGKVIIAQSQHATVFSTQRVQYPYGKLHCPSSAKQT